MASVAVVVVVVVVAVVVVEIISTLVAVGRGGDYLDTGSGSTVAAIKPDRSAEKRILMQQKW